MKNEDMKQDVFRLNSMVSGNVNALQTQANMTLSMQEQMLNMATSVNDLQGDLRAEVLVIGQSMANTTMLVTERFDEISSTNMALQESVARMWNMTDQIDAKLAKL